MQHYFVFSVNFYHFQILASLSRVLCNLLRHYLAKLTIFKMSYFLLSVDRNQRFAMDPHLWQLVEPTRFAKYRIAAVEDQKNQISP